MAKVEISVVDLPKFKDFVEKVENVIGMLEHGDHWDTQQNAANELRDALVELLAEDT